MASSPKPKSSPSAMRCSVRWQQQIVSLEENSAVAEIPPPMALALLCVLAGAAMAQIYDDDAGVTHHWVYQTSAEIVCLSRTRHFFRARVLTATPALLLIDSLKPSSNTNHHRRC